LIVDAVLRLRAFAVAPLSFPDTVGYMQMATLPVWDGHFLAGQRPFVVPLVYQLLGRDPALIADFQSGFALVSWAILAGAVASMIQSRWLKPVAFGVVLGFSLSKEVTAWDRVLLSESVALSLMVLFVASWLRLLRSWRWPKVLVVVATGFLWACAREPNAYVLCVLSVLLAVAVATGHAGRPCLAIAVTFALIGAANDVSSSRGQRWVYPFLNVMAQRILPDAERTAYFREHGMPVSPRLLSFAGKWANSEDRALFEDPSLADFRDWMHHRARAMYAGFLISHPLTLFGEPLWHIRQLLRPSMDFYAAPAFSPPLPQSIDWLFTFSRDLRYLYLGGAVIIGFAVLVARRDGLSPVWVVPFSLLLFTYPVAVLTWHGDAMGVDRHTLQFAVQLQLGLWLLLLFAVDTVAPIKARK